MFHLNAGNGFGVCIALDIWSAQPLCVLYFCMKWTKRSNVDKENTDRATEQTVHSLSPCPLCTYNNGEQANRFNRIESDCVCAPVQQHLFDRARARSLIRSFGITNAFYFLYILIHILPHIFGAVNKHIQSIGTRVRDFMVRFYRLKLVLHSVYTYIWWYVFLLLLLLLLRSFLGCCSPSELFSMSVALLLCVLGVLAIIAWK